MKDGSMNIFQKPIGTIFVAYLIFYITYQTQDKQTEIKFQIL